MLVWRVLGEPLSVKITEKAPRTGTLAEEFNSQLNKIKGASKCSSTLEVPYSILFNYFVPQIVAGDCFDSNLVIALAFDQVSLLAFYLCLYFDFLPGLVFPQEW